MFGLFNKDHVKKLEKAYDEILLKARDVQRSGDIKGYAKLMAESEEILKQIDELRAQA